MVQRRQFEAAETPLISQVLQFRHELRRPSLYSIYQPLVGAVDWSPYDVSILQMGSHQTLVEERQGDHVNAAKRPSHQSQHLVPFCSCRCGRLPELEDRVEVDAQVLLNGHLLQFETSHSVRMTWIPGTSMKDLTLCFIEWELPKVGPLSHCIKIPLDLQIRRSMKCYQRFVYRP